MLCAINMLQGGRNTDVADKTLAVHIHYLLVFLCIFPGKVFKKRHFPQHILIQNNQSSETTSFHNFFNNFYLKKTRLCCILTLFALKLRQKTE